MRFQPSYGANETFVLTTKLPVDVSIPSAARIGARVGFTSVMEKAGKGAKGRTATIGFVERDGKGVYAINISGDRPMLVTPDMAEWAALTAEDALKAFQPSVWSLMQAQNDVKYVPPVDRAKTLASFTTTPKLPFPPLPAHIAMMRSQISHTMVRAKPPVCKPGQPRLQEGYVPDSTGKYSIGAIKVGEDKLVYSSDAEYNTLRSDLRDASLHPCSDDTSIKTVSGGAAEQAGSGRAWYMHPTVLVGGTLAAVALFLHMTKGKE